MCLDCKETMIRRVTKEDVCLKLLYTVLLPRSL